MKNLPIAKEGFIYLLVLLILTIIFYITFRPLAIICFVLLIFVGFFFRNPYRRIPEGKNLILSPADGVVMSICEYDEQEFLKCKSIKISIFLSIFNVHINRSPIKGQIKYKNYRPGEFLPAFKSHASEINERNTIGIEGENGFKVLVNQITGFIARRIVCWVDIGDILEHGERFGLIKFGSCTEIIVPAGVTINVKPGDKVKGAQTIIGVMN